MSTFEKRTVTIQSHGPPWWVELEVVSYNGVGSSLSTKATISSSERTIDGLTAEDLEHIANGINQVLDEAISGGHIELHQEEIREGDHK